MLDKAEKDTKMKIWESFSKCYTLTAKAKLEGVKKYLGDILMNNCKFIVFAHH